MTRLRFLGALVLAMAFPGACKTSGDKDEASFVDGEENVVKLDPRKSDMGGIPESLWSPGQRRSTAGYYTLVGEYLALGGDVPKAYALYESAYNLDPNAFLGGKLVSMEVALGRMDQAAVDARKMVLLYPKDSYLHLLYGQVLARQEKFDEAIRELDSAVAAQPTMVEAHLLLISIHGQAKHVDLAIAQARALVKAVPDSIAGWAILAKLHLMSAKKKEALDPARRAYELQNGNPELILIYALALELNGKSKDAVALYEKLYRLNPTNEELIARMVGLYRELGDLKDALELLDELARLPGAHRPAVQMQRSFILWELKRNEEAHAILVKLVAEFPDSDRLQLLNAFGHEKVKKWEGALAIYRTIPENSQFKQNAEIRAIMVLKELKRFDEAMIAVNRITLHEPPPWEIFEIGASVLSEQNKELDAVSLLREGLQKLPNQPRLLFLLGVYQEKAGDLEGCIATMRTVIKVDPANSSAYNYLGYLFAERGQNLDEAEKLVKKALELKPGDGFYLDSLAWVYFQRKQYDKAILLLEQAVKIVPDEGVVFEHFGDIYRAQGKEADARKSYERALKAVLEKRDRRRIEEKGA